jgi:hypothetical protein
LKISKTTIAAPLAVALAIPAFAVGQGAPNEEAQPPSTAYGVICQRAPYEASKTEKASTGSGTEFSACVRALREGTNGQRSSEGAAKRACTEGDLTGRPLARCVASTEALVHGLRGLKAQP